jgi:undecaprenyl diphosphate synthase
VDLLIRTGGDHRLSNFLLWQAAYAELFFLKTLWPDFTSDEFEKILGKFDKIDRRFGGLNQ